MASVVLSEAEKLYIVHGVQVAVVGALREVPLGRGGVAAAAAAAFAPGSGRSFGPAWPGRACGWW